MAKNPFSATHSYWPFHCEQYEIGLPDALFGDGKGSFDKAETGEEATITR